MAFNNHVLILDDVIKVFLIVILTLVLFFAFTLLDY